MSDDAPMTQGSFRFPARGHEFLALVIAMGVVFILVQLGAPIIRTFQFLDPKLRDYFIGMSFAAFPFVHRSSKRYLSRLSRFSEPELQDSAPWYVAGVIAAAVLFGWNQFVSFLSGLSLGIMMQAFPDPAKLNVQAEDLLGVQMVAALAVVLPLCAVASLYAGVLINRHTRSHTFASVGTAAIGFVSINVLFTEVLAPNTISSIVSLLSQGGAEALQVALLFCLVGLIVFGFGSAGVMISRMNRERPLGKIVEAARKLSAEQREALATEILLRARAGTMPQGQNAPPPAPGPMQLSNGAEP